MIGGKVRGSSMMPSQIMLTFSSEEDAQDFYKWWNEVGKKKFEEYQEESE